MTASVLLLAAPVGFRSALGSGLEWSVFLPVRAVLGWEGRSLMTYLQNRQLQKELTQERLELARLHDAGRENAVLRRMLGMAARADVALVPARVVGRSLDPGGEVLWAEVDGRAAQGQAALTAEGLLGRVARVAGTRAWIETLWHPRVAVSVIDARSREQGILRWDPARAGEFAIQPVPLQADFKTGDPIVTSGLGEVFPRGILVGNVMSGEVDSRTQLQTVRVRPAVRRGRVQEVFLVAGRAAEIDASALYPGTDLTPSGPPPLPGGPGLRP